MASREPEELPLGRGAFERAYGRFPPVVLFNRFFEQNPTAPGGTALLTRPATKNLTAIGTGPIRALFWQPGAFNDDLFVVSGTTLYRYDGTTATAITGTVQDNGVPELTAVVGPDFEHLYIADGQLLSLYRGTSRATATLTLTPNSPPDISTQTLQIGSTYYQWAASLSGTPDGSSGNPFQVLVGADDEESLANMFAAINASGDSGVDYSSTIVSPNTQVEATDVDATTLDIRARARGTGGNSIDTLVTGSDIAWGGATMSGGGSNILNGVTMPELFTAVALSDLGGFVVVVCGNSDRWYFIRPGEITIDPLDFYTAEDESDQLVTVRKIGDALAFLGNKSIEFWYLTGDTTVNGDAFLPVDGQAYSIGVVPGTVVKIRDFVMFVGTDNQVYKLFGRPEPVTPNHGVYELIRQERVRQRESA
jgi:hypothetical protein